MTDIFVSIDYTKNINYSLCHNHIPICRLIEIKNNGLSDLDNLQIKVSGRYIFDNESPIYGAIKSEKSLKITNFQITPKAEDLYTLTERIISSFELEVIVKGETIYKKDFELELMAFDQWLGTTIMPQIIASFCMPNQPSVNHLVLKAATKLKEIAGTSSFNEYQDGNPQTVLKQIAAIFATIHEEQ